MYSKSTCISNVNILKHFDWCVHDHNNKSYSCHLGHCVVSWSLTCTNTVHHLEVNAQLEKHKCMFGHLKCTSAQAMDKNGNARTVCSAQDHRNCTRNAPDCSLPIHRNWPPSVDKQCTSSGNYWECFVCGNPEA